jgi:multiple sugar transport system permease protein
LLVAAMATIVSLVVSLLAAYAFSRFEFKGKKIFMVMFLTNNMFPTVLLLIPLYTLMRQLGLLFTPASLVLSYTTFTIPFSVWLLNGYLHDLPHSLEEVALVDGANRAQAFLRIILPLMIPCLIATGVYIFMTSWNEYTFAVMFKRRQQNHSGRTQEDGRTIQN